MKLLEKNKSPAYLRAALKRGMKNHIFRFNRNKATKISRNGRKFINHAHKIIAPVCLDLSKLQHHDLMVGFVEEIKKHARKGTIHKVAQVHLCFRETRIITSSGGLWLLANLERLRSESPYTKFTITRPPATRLNNRDNNRYPVVDSVMNWIGIYSALGLQKREMRQLPTVDCWEATRGAQVASAKVGELLEKITLSTGQDHKALYRPLVEAMSNSVEHAYRPDLYSSPQPETKWWCFATIMNGRLITLVCDLGLGISKTLPKTQSKTFFSNIVDYIGHALSSDSDFIRASLQLKKSATKLDYRGKGGPDLQSVIEKIPNAKLAIYSNKGSYFYTNRGKANPETWFDHKQSIKGTIVECSIDLPTQGINK
ncbi:hypothetical protein L2106_21660 [Citrobacter portucalensis]|uniref:ATP-binding protein n=1 Tax=Citrobacter portucalensis TaxID=1639133 RepID=A0ABZ0H2Q5_9ENTR|nr:MULTISPECIES: hypothetical protein [Citrobacter]EKA2135044.1 hypothetical protein [Citrobacter freundii]EKV6481295.1 hypothetical protein [Citrobacter freundii]MDA8501804.1 hypothetical protein [Citrobacter sp. Awk 2]MDE9575998.1 hypothetical protein [Citrobacter portucalensis]MDE9650781.1 hypothetical protein [Citrobacter portucalensis]